MECKVGKVRNLWWYCWTYRQCVWNLGERCKDPKFPSKDTWRIIVFESKWWILGIFGVYINDFCFKHPYSEVGVYNPSRGAGFIIILVITKSPCIFLNQKKWPSIWRNLNTSPRGFLRPIIDSNNLRIQTCSGCALMPVHHPSVWIPLLIFHLKRGGW